MYWYEMSYNKYNQDNNDLEPDVFDNIDFSISGKFHYGLKDNVYEKKCNDVIAQLEVNDAYNSKITE